MNFIVFYRKVKLFDNIDIIIKSIWQSNFTKYKERLLE